VVADEDGAELEATLARALGVAIAAAGLDDGVLTEKPAAVLNEYALLKEKVL
jgi:hypothetical protein